MTHLPKQTTWCWYWPLCWSMQLLPAHHENPPLRRVLACRRVYTFCERATMRRCELHWWWGKLPGWPKCLLPALQDGLTFGRWTGILLSELPARHSVYGDQLKIPVRFNMSCAGLSGRWIGFDPLLLLILAGWPRMWFNALLHYNRCFAACESFLRLEMR